MRVYCAVLGLTRLWCDFIALTSIFLYKPERHSRTIVLVFDNWHRQYWGIDQGISSENICYDQRENITEKHTAREHQHNIQQERGYGAVQYEPLRLIPYFCSRRRQDRTDPALCAARTAISVNAASKLGRMISIGRAQKKTSGFPINTSAALINCSL